MKKHQRIVELLEFEKSDDEKIKKKIKQLLMTTNLNLAGCYLKLNENLKTIESCEKALKLHANNEKALIRIGLAYSNLSNFDEAVKFYNQVLELNKDNMEARNQILVAKQKLKEPN